jgi:hypothetical protein
MNGVYGVLTANYSRRIKRRIEGTVNLCGQGL